MLLPPNDPSLPTEYQVWPRDVLILASYCYPRDMDLREFSGLPFEERLAIACELGLDTKRLASAMKWYWGWRRAYARALTCKSRSVGEMDGGGRIH